MNSTQFSGVYTALVTPMKDGRVDYGSLERVVRHQIENGVSGLVSVGTTGESPTLTAEEHIEVIVKTVRFASGRVPVIAGTGSNNTAEAVAYTREADAAGADGFLQVSPYYNKPTQEGQFLHFGAVAAVTDKPVMLYSIPGRCVVDISVETCARLYERYPNVCAMKEAGGQCDKVASLKRILGEDYAVMSGDDNMTVPFMASGASGVVSVVSNLFPAELSEMVSAALGNDYHRAREISARFAEFFRMAFVEPNPVPIKYAMRINGLIDSDAVRLPLCSLLIGNKERIKQALETLPAVAPPAGNQE